MPNFHYRALTETGILLADRSPRRASRKSLVVLIIFGWCRSILLSRKARHQPPALGSSSNRASDPRTSRSSRSISRSYSRPVRGSIARSNCWRDSDIGRLRSTVGAIRSSILAGESFADALCLHLVFPPVYVALVRVGEASGTLENILHVLASDRSRAETLRRKVTDALRYPAFLLFAASCVLVFFLMFVLPQFGAVFHDFGAKFDPIAGSFLALSEFMNAQKDLIGCAAIIVLATALLLARHRKFRAAVILRVVRLPVIRTW